MGIHIIAAMSENRVIGKDNDIPWNIPGEMKRFKELTLGGIIVMGRRTFESIGSKPLPKRKNIVISRSLKAGEGFEVFPDLAAAFKAYEGQEIYIAGGQGIYRDSLPSTDNIYLTIVQGEFEGDTYFPDFDESEFKITEKTPVDGVIPYTYYTYSRI